MLLDAGLVLYDSSSLSQSGQRPASSIYQHGFDSKVNILVKIMFFAESWQSSEIGPPSTRGTEPFMMSGIHRFEKGRVRALEALGGLQVGIAWQRTSQGRVAGRGAAAGRVCRAVYHICKALQRSSHSLLRSCQANASLLKDSWATRQ